MKKFKQITALFLCFALAFSFVGCGNNDIEEAEQTVHEMFAALKILDMNALGKIVEDSEDFLEDEDALLTGNTEEILKAMMGGLEYKILSSQKTDDDTVNVKVSISAIDMKPVFKDFFSSAFNLAFTPAFSDMSEDEITAKMEELLLEKMTAPDLEKVTSDVTLEVSKEGKTWEVDMDDAFTDAILGGLEEAIEEVQSSFSF